MIEPEQSSASNHDRGGGPEERSRGLDETLRPASLPMHERSPSAAPKMLGDYQILDEIARGGMGVVYKARQLSLNRIVALKTIRAGELADHHEVQRFYVEAEAAAKLDHPHIVPIYEIGSAGGQHFYSMGLVEGPSLAQHLGAGPLPPRQAAELVWQIAGAMEYAHQQGVVHRDLKPANVLLSPEAAETGGAASQVRAGSLGKSTASATGDHHRNEVLPFQPKVTDFGLAKQIRAGSELTSTGQILGTPSYMPPEQAQGETNIGPSADIYALGAVLYAALTGRPPFQAATPIETLKQVVEQEVVPPGRLNPAIDRDIDTICVKCLQKAPERRYESAAALAADLRRYLNREPILARPVGGLERALRWCRRNPAAATAFGGLSLALVAVIVLLLVAAQLRVSRETAENRKLRLEMLESEAVRRNLELTSARLAAENERKLATAQRYYALLNGARERAASHEPGWAYAGLADVAAAAELEFVPADPLELRNEAARFLAGFDLRRRGSVSKDVIYRSHKVAFDPAGKHLAVAPLKNPAALRIRLCSLPDVRVEHDLIALCDAFWQIANKNHDGVDGLAFISGGDCLAILTRSGWVQLWDLTNATPAHASYRVPQGVPEVFVFDPTSRRAFFYRENELLEWADMAKPETKTVASGPIRWLDLTPDGSLLAAGNKESTRLFDARSSEPIRELAHGGKLGKLSLEGRLLALWQETSILLIDVATGAVVHELRDDAIGSASEGILNHLHFAPGGGYLASAANDQKIRIWDTTSGQLLFTQFMGGADTICPAFSPDGRFLASTGDKEGVLFEINGPEVLRNRACHRQALLLFDVTPDGSLAATLSGAHQAGMCEVALWPDSLASPHGSVTYSSPLGEPALALSRSGAWLAARARHLPYAALWRIDRSTTFDVTRVSDAQGANAVTISFARDEERFFAVGDDVHLRSLSLPDLNEQWRWTNATVAHILGTGAIRGIEGGKEHTIVATASGYLHRLDSATGRPAAPWPIGARITCLAMNQGETLVAAGTTDGLLVLAAMPGGEILLRQTAHSDLVTAIDFDPSGRWLATGSRDKSIRLWRVESGAARPWLTLRPPGPVVRVRFAGQNRLLALVQNESGLREWRLDALFARLKTMGLDGNERLQGDALSATRE